LTGLRLARTFLDVAKMTDSIADSTGGAKSLVKGLQLVDLIARNERGLNLSELVLEAAAELSQRHGFDLPAPTDAMS
jgi:hypothetical protein